MCKKKNLAIGLFAAGCLLLGCSENSRPSESQHCQDYLECLKSIAEQTGQTAAYEQAVALYGQQGVCEQSASAREQCEQSCQQALSLLLSSDPNACSGVSLDGGVVVGDGGTPNDVNLEIRATSYQSSYAGYNAANGSWFFVVLVNVSNPAGAEPLPLAGEAFSLEVERGLRFPGSSLRWSCPSGTQLVAGANIDCELAWEIVASDLPTKLHFVMGFRQAEVAFGPDLCRAAQHRCQGICVSDMDVANCGTSCSPCTAPDHATATCDGISCDFTCDPGYRYSGLGCVCDFGTHECADICVSDYGINNCGMSCTPCTAPVNATATCDGVDCGFECNSGYHLSGQQCVRDYWVQQTSGTTDNLYGVWGSSSGDIYAVGGVLGATGYGTILHSTGNGTWTQQMTGSIPEPLRGVWGSGSGDIYAVGGHFGDAGITYHSAGNGLWTQVPELCSGVRFNDVWVSAAGEVFIVGESDSFVFGVIFATDGAGTVWVESPSYAVDSVWGIAGGDVYAVGEDFIATYIGSGAWNATDLWPTFSGPNLNGIWGSSTTDLYAVGDNGVLFHSTGNEIWTEQLSPTPNDLHTVWGSGSNDIYIAGIDGVFHSTGNGIWVHQLSTSINAIWGTGPNDVYVVGHSGIIYHHE